MSEWNIVLVIITLVGFFISIVTPIIKLNTAITKLISAVETLESSFEKFTSGNSRSHERIWKELDAHGDELNEHETRISILEGGHKNEH